MRSMLFYILFCCALTSHGQDIRVDSVLQEYNFDSVRTELRRLTGELPIMVNGQFTTISSRLYNHPGNEVAFQYAKARFIEYGLEVDSLLFSANGKNLFAIKRGSIFPERVCMIGAHYDNLPTGSFAPGADDNASGCSAVLEAARLLSQHDYANTVIFALWDEEELGLIGSTAYASQSDIHGDSLLGYINLDMIGWDGNDNNVSEIHVRPIANSINILHVIQDCNTLYNIGLMLEIVNPGSINTDHHPFWQNGYSAVGIAEEYTGDFNPNWHAITDSLIKFNLQYFNDNCRLAIAALTTLALNKSGYLTDEDVIQTATIFPNPLQTEFQIQFSQVILNPVNITVFDHAGRVVFRRNFEKIDQIEIDLSANRAGSYLLKMESNEIVRIIPMIKI